MLCCTHSPDKEGSNLYGIVELMLVKSGHSHAATHHLTPEELHLIASNLSTVFATFILLGAVVAGIYFYKKRRYIIMQEMFQFMIDRRFYHLSFYFSLSLLFQIDGDSFTDSREELSVGFARFQNDSAGNVEIAIDASFEQALARPPLDPDAPPRSSNIQQEPKSPFTEAPEIPDTCSDSCHGSSNVKPAAPAAWKKFTRAFANPLFGDPSAAVGVRSRGKIKIKI